MNDKPFARLFADEAFAEFFWKDAEQIVGDQRKQFLAELDRLSDNPDWLKIVDLIDSRTAIEAGISEEVFNRAYRIGQRELIHEILTELAGFQESMSRRFRELLELTR